MYMSSASYGEDNSNQASLETSEIRHEQDKRSMCCANTVGTAMVKGAAGMQSLDPDLAKVLHKWLSELT